MEFRLESPPQVAEKFCNVWRLTLESLVDRIGGNP